MNWIYLVHMKIESIHVTRILQTCQCHQWWRFELCFKTSIYFLCLVTSQQLAPSDLYLYYITIYSWDFNDKWKGKSSQKKIQTNRKTQNLKDGRREQTPNSKGETGQSRPWGKTQWHSLYIYIYIYIFKKLPLCICSIHNFFENQST